MVQTWHQDLASLRMSKPLSESEILSVNLLAYVSGESLGYRSISTASMLEWLRNLLSHHSQGSSTERWSRNILRVVTVRGYCILRGSLTSLFIFLWFSGVGRATHDVVNLLKSFDLLLELNLPPLAPSAWWLTAMTPELTVYQLVKTLVKKAVPLTGVWQIWRNTIIRSECSTH